MKSLLSMLLCLLLSGFNLESYRTMQAERELLTAPVADEAVRGTLSGSFLQSWLCAAFTAEHWDTELEKMKALGMDYLIVETRLDGQPLYSTDPAVADDMLSLAFQAAQTHGIQLILGLTNGSGAYYASADAYINWLTPWAKPFEAFHEQDLADAAKIMDEILAKYGGTYGDVIYGWYFAHEFFNNPLYSQAAWNSIGRHINGYVQAIERSCAPEKPLIFSPFYYIGLPYTKPGRYCSGLKRLFAEAGLRPGDVFMPQDGFGTVTKFLPAEIVTPSLLATWIEALGKTAAENNVTFWINNEAFSGGDIDVRPPAQVAMQVLASDQYASTHFMFSWNHYYSATYYTEKAELEHTFANIFRPA